MHAAALNDVRDLVTVSRQLFKSSVHYHLYSTPPAMPPSAPFNFQIIVVAPEEDQQPDLLVFGDTIQEPELATPPDFSSLDDALSRLHSGETTPTFNRTGVHAVVMPRRSDSLPRDDSEIIEVVKVRRTFSPAQEEDPPVKPKPKSLRSRAGKAFRSIKNLARVSSSSSRSVPTTPYANDAFAASRTSHGTLSSSTTSPPLRRGSVILTNLFRPPSRAEADAASPSSSLDLHPAERYPDAMEDDYDHEHEHEIDDQESIAPRAPSPTPSTFTTNIRRRLSVLSFARKSHSREPPRPPSPPTLSRGSTVPSSSTTSLPSTPTEEPCTHPLPSTKDLADDPDRTIMDMHLDSLHFEALSFDADQF